MIKFIRKFKGWLALLLAAAIYFGYGWYYPDEPKAPLTLNQLEEHIARHDISAASADVSFTETLLALTFKDKTEAKVRVPTASLPDYYSRLQASGTTVNTTEESTSILSWVGLLATIYMISIPIRFIFNWLFKKLLRYRKRQGHYDDLTEEKSDDDDDEEESSIFSFGLDNIIAPNPTTSHVKFKDVAGIDEIKGELEQVVGFIKNSKRLTALGGRIPRGTLLVGPAGTGKTLLAKAVAGEAGVPFYAVSASSVDGGFVGDGSKFFRRTFRAAKRTAKKHGAAIIFIDEIDAVGRKRSKNDGKWAAQSLNQLLIEMDGFEENTTVFVIGATNRVEDLDPALRRPGRFDREIHMRLPDLKGRKQILEVTAKSRKARLRRGIDLTAIARGVAGFTGAEVANLLNEAAIHASTRKGKSIRISPEDFEFAREKITLGLKSPIFMSEAERRITARHEAGHALIALALEDDLDPVYKATIAPRGRALGMVSMLPDEDRTHMTLRRLKARLAVTFGGRMAEQLMATSPDDITSGASSDLQQITNLATRMILEWGFGSSPYRAFRHAADEHNGTVGENMEISSALQQKLDGEIDTLIDSIEARVHAIMTANLDVMTKIADDLFEKETLEGDYLRATYKPLIQPAVPPEQSDDIAEPSRPHLATSAGVRAAE